MPERILIELTVENADDVSFGKLAAWLRTLERRGARITGVEALESDSGAALAQYLRLALKAEPLAGRLARAFLGK